MEDYPEELQEEISEVFFFFFFLFIYGDIFERNSKGILGNKAARISEGTAEEIHEAFQVGIRRGLPEKIRT